MKFLFTFIIVFTCYASSFSQEQVKESTTTTYYLIRHAEKDRSDKSNRNPELTEIGKTRAQHWNEVFQNIAFDRKADQIIGFIDNTD